MKEEPLKGMTLYRIHPEEDDFTHGPPMQEIVILKAFSSGYSVQWFDGEDLSLKSWISKEELAEQWFESPEKAIKAFQDHLLFEKNNAEVKFYRLLKRFSDYWSWSEDQK